MPLTTFKATLKNSYMLTSNVKHFIFQCDTNHEFHWIPGQFITLHFTQNDKELKRSYSIANEPNNNNLIEFAAGYVSEGPGTEYLFHLQPDDEVTMSGPYGRLTLKEHTPKRYILIGTSTGITPYRAMIGQLKRLLQSNPTLEIVLLQGVQKKEDILYRDEFLAFAHAHARVSFCACLSKEADINPNDFEFSGYVQHYFPQLNFNPEQDMVYLCGNPGMIDESFLHLKELGFPLQSIIREKYISR